MLGWFKINTVASCPVCKFTGSDLIGRNHWIGPDRTRFYCYLNIIISLSVNAYRYPGNK